VPVARPRGAVRQAAGMTRPSSLATLWRAGAIEPRAFTSLVRTLPWLLGRGPSLGVLSHLNARALGPKPAIHDRWGSLTWSELDRRTNRLARALTALGIRPGDRVATLLRNGREIVEAILATQKLGVVVCPLNTWARPAELRVALGRAEPRLLVYDLDHAGQVDSAAPNDLPVVAVGELTASMDAEPSYEELLAAQADAPLRPLTRSRGTPAIVIHTSGTTGSPKGAQRGAGGQPVEGLLRLLDLVPFQRRDVVLCPAPMFHSFGLLVLALGSVLGVTFVLPHRFDPEDALDLVERHEVTACALVPVMLRRILDAPDVRRATSSLRIVLSGGSALPPDLRAAAIGRFGAIVYDLYGSTEAGWISVATPEDMAADPDTVGRPVGGVEVAIRSDDGAPLGPGDVGEIFVRSDAVFEGYTTGEDLPGRDGYLATGDLGRLDGDGRLHVQGRADDMVVVGGENVYPAEVEEVIRGVKGVTDAAVGGTPDPRYGQVLVAFVVGEAAEERILEACREALASFKVPRRVERVPDLPRNATGKILLRELLEPGGTEKE
jgi:acyl-CoA synthetase (AMP-forming)/AMP-acid ligase II